MILFHKTQFNLFVGFAVDELKTLTTLNIKLLKFSNCLARALGFNSHNHLLASSRRAMRFSNPQRTVTMMALHSKTRQTLNCLIPFVSMTFLQWVPYENLAQAPERWLFS